MKLGWVPVAIGLVGALVAPACSATGRRADCDAFIGLVNEEVDKIRRAKNKLDDGASPSEQENLATTLENAAHTVDGVAIRDGKLVALRRDYTALLRREARDRRFLVVARKANEKDRMAKLKADLKAAAKDEAKLVDSIDKACAR